MRTSREVHAQILWDERLDPTRFTVLVDVHGPEPKRIPLPRFEPDGDIPWHRVVGYTCDDVPCWDREGLDRLDELANSGLFAPRLLGVPFWEPRTAVRYDGQQWVPWVGAHEEPQALTVLTWNVLWDRFQPELLDSGTRWPCLLDEALAAGADVLAFQEVTRRFHQLVLAHPRVRERFWVSHGPDHPDVGAADLLLLGTGSVKELGFCRLRPHKAALGAVLGSGPLIVTTHLSSDHSRNAAERRQEELQRIRAATDGASGSIWLGDFNLADEAELLDTRDAWLALQPSQPTFDPLQNPLAVHSSRSGRPVRIDRILLRGAFRPTRVARLGLEATAGLHPSDHYGVLAALELQDDAVFLGPSTRRSALAWLPPPGEALDAVQQVRQQRDPAYGHWPPHLNVLWPFVPEADLEEALALLADLETDPFPAGLSQPGRFPGRRPVRFLGPRDPGPWEALQRRLRQRFPTCAGGAPHLTVARDDEPVPPLDLEAPVEALAILTRRGDEPFETRALWHLGGELEWLDLPEPATPAGPPPTLPEGAVLVGSRRLGVALRGADVDVLWFGAIEDAEHAFAAHGTLRRVERAGLPGLVVRGAHRIDVVVLPATATVEGRLALDEAVCHGLTAISDPDALRERVGERWPVFAEVLLQVKAWARAQALDQAALGGLEGLAWAVLVATSLGDGTPQEELLHFFAHWAAWDWSVGVGCAAGPPVSIGTPSAPIRVITTRARRAPLEAALWQAWELLDGGADPEVLRIPPPWHRLYEEAVLVEGATEEAEGWARGRALALIDALGPVAPRSIPLGFALGLPRGTDPLVVDGILRAWVGHDDLIARRVWTWEVA